VGFHPAQRRVSFFGSAVNFKFIPALVLASALLCAQAATITGRVVAVADGDTVTVLDDSNTQHKIRLSGIEAPEKSNHLGSGQNKA